MAQAARFIDSVDARRTHERVCAAGPDGLSDADLVAVLLGNGRGELDAMHFAEALLSRFGGVLGLLSANADSLQAVRSLSGAEVASLLAIRELLKRAELAKLKNAPLLSSSDEVRRFLGLHLAGREREVFGALLLDTRHRLIAAEDIFLGSIDRTMVYPREVAKCCLRHNAAAVVLYHNHPNVAEPTMLRRFRFTARDGEATRFTAT